VPSARLTAVPGGLAGVPSDCRGYAPEVFVPAVRSNARDVSVPGGLPRVPSRLPAVFRGSLVVHATNPSPKTTTLMRITVRFMSASPDQDALHASAGRRTVTQRHHVGCGVHTKSGGARRRLHARIAAQMLIRRTWPKPVRPSQSAKNQTGSADGRSQCSRTVLSGRRHRDLSGARRVHPQPHRRGLQPRHIAFAPLMPGQQAGRFS
jgi:hypothetical protein